MNERTLRVLEFTKIRAQLAEFAVSEPGRERITALVPSSDPDTVRLLQEQTEEALAVRAYVGGSPMVYFTDITGHVKIAQAGGTLYNKALLDIAETLKASRLVRQSLVTQRTDTPRLTVLGSQLTANRSTEEEIFNAILSEDEIADRASAELYDIRRHIRQINERMRDKLNGLAHSPTMSKYLQDTIVTMRNNRYVVPVRAECRQYVPGIVHDQSASGQTLYIEPMSVVEAGNDLKQWSVKEQQEIRRILDDLTNRVAPDGDNLLNNLSILSELDCIFAKALLAREMDAVPPKINDRYAIRLVRARHPLIARDTVVPINLWIGDDFKQLVITGPNTGGKTVTLKTVGLFALMTQAGLQIPAGIGSEMSVFDDVFADIGDEQSIEQSLSTFSSHMTNIVEILKHVTNRSLALFDELGAGTDPTEGAALAMAILNALMGEHVTVLATTHYSELKAYALSTVGVENASVEFNVETLRPTYRLSIGVPGKSNAFEISRKLGLPDRLIHDANERLSKDQIQFEDVIANAEYHRQIAEKERALAEEAHRDTQKMLDDAERMRKELEEQRQSLQRKAKEDARKVLTKAQREAETIIAELKKSKAASELLREHELHNMRKTLQDALDQTSEHMPQPEIEGEAPASLEIGDTVLITNLNTRGTVATLPDAKGDLVVQAGAMKIKSNLAMLRRAEPEKPKKTRGGGGTVGVAMKKVALDCDVRGLTLEEAIMAVDLFLDGAVMQSLKSVNIIHGKGTGVLRAGIQEHLKKYPAVKSFRLGQYGEGEDGVTVVTLK